MSEPTKQEVLELAKRKHVTTAAALEMLLGAKLVGVDDDNLDLDVREDLEDE